MLRRIRAALAAFIYPEMTRPPAPATSDEGTDNAITGGAHDQATAVQARDVDSLTVDRSTRTGPTVTNNAHGPVGFQTGNVSGGVSNLGGNNRFSGTALGHGATVNNVGTNSGTLFQADTINSGINY